MSSRGQTISSVSILLTILTACGSPGTGPLPFPQPAPTPVPPGGVTPSTRMAQEILTLTNQARATGRICGSEFFAAVPALAYNAQLEAAAQGHASDMAQRNYFSHTSLDGRTYDQRVMAAGYIWTMVGENISAGQTTAREVVDGWLASAGHCRNIMNPGFTELGVGYAISASSTYGSYFVQDFGRR